MNDIVTVSSLEKGILHIRLNRPDQLNALSQAVLQRLFVVFNEAKHDAAVLAILLTGEGKGFCAGADIKELLPLDGQSGLVFANLGQQVFSALESLGKPSLAAIHGFAFGGGCELAMAATMRIAANNVVFGQPEIKLGVIPGFGGTQRLSRLIGKGRALDICLTGRRFQAEEALQWGFITEIVAPSDLEQRAISILQELTSLSSSALESIMTVIDQGYDLSLQQAFALEAAHFGLACSSPNKNEGVSAFLEKRTALFKAS